MSVESICIVGASGYVGGSLYRYLSSKEKYRLSGTSGPDRQNLGFASLDVRSKEQLRTFFEAGRFDCIVWCAGNKDVKACEVDYNAAYAVNAKPLEDMAELFVSGIVSGRLIYISTDYVFDGKRGGYKAGDETTPATNYGKTKLAGERAVLSIGSDAKVVRSAAITGSGSTFFDWLLGALRKEEELSMFSNSFFSPTPLTFFCECMESILDRYDEYGALLHLVAKEKLSRYQLAQKAAEIIHSKTNIEPMQLSFENTLFQPDLSLVPSEKIAELQQSSLTLYLQKEISKMADKHRPEAIK